MKHKFAMCFAVFLPILLGNESCDYYDYSGDYMKIEEGDCQDQTIGYY